MSFNTCGSLWNQFYSHKLKQKSLECPEMKRFVYALHKGPHSYSCKNVALCEEHKLPILSEMSCPEIKYPVEGEE